LRRHAVIVGDRPPLLLVHGWPETWYAWRLLMPALARDFEVISVDQRGIGLSDKPQDGYDSGTLAGDLVALMAALGHSVSAPSSHHAAQLRPSKASADPPASSSCSKIAQASCSEPPESAVHPSLRLFSCGYVNASKHPANPRWRCHCLPVIGMSVDRGRRAPSPTRS
jgi:hypothetical protein